MAQQSGSRVTTHRRLVGAVVVAILCLAGSQPIYASTKAKPKPKPKPVCHLLPAATGANKSTDPNMNITSGDIVTNATTLTWTLRLTSASTSMDNNSPTGIEWTYFFNVGDQMVTLSMVAGPFGVQDASGLNAKVTVANNAVVYTVPLASLAKPPLSVTIVNHKTVLAHMKGSVEQAIEYPAQSGERPIPFGNTYSTTSTATYLAGTASCLVAGS